MKAIKKLSVILAVILLMAGMVTVSASAAPKLKLNRKSKTMTVGQTFILKVKGINSGKIKKVTFKSNNKKVATVSKKIAGSKKSRGYKIYKKACVRAKKKGKATITARVTFRTPKSTLKTKKLKFKVTVKKAKSNKFSDKTTERTENADNTSWYDEDIEWINSYTVFDKWQDKYLLPEDATPYGFVYNPSGDQGPDWYSKSDYEKIMTELNRILKEVHITEGNNINTMTDQEKAYRIGRWMTDNIDYAGTTQTLYNTLFTHKTKCQGFSELYKMLCTMSNVECEFIHTTGHYINGQNMNHAWNIVKLGNYWYEMDITFARNLRNDSQPGVVLSDYFRPYNVIHDDREYNYLHPYYTSKEFTDSHPIDTVELPVRGKVDGITFMTDEELYNLPR